MFKITLMYYKNQRKTKLAIEVVEIGNFKDSLRLMENKMKDDDYCFCYLEYKGKQVNSMTKEDDGKISYKVINSILYYECMGM